MSALTRSFRYIFIPVLLTFIGIAAAQHFEAVWHVWLPSIIELPYYLFPVATILSLQFNYTRISILAILLLTYYAYEQGLILDGLPDNIRNQVFLSGSLIIGLFAISRDRALFSFHTIKTVGGIVLCVAIGATWQLLTLKIGSPTILDVPPAINLLTPLYIPIGISSIIVCIYAVWRASLIDSVLAVTLFTWLFIYYVPNGLPLPLLLSLLATAYICVVIAESYHLAYRDDLTGLSSRRALNTMALSLNSHYSVAMVDIDHFKNFNDTYGHDVGDQVLQLIASKLTKVKGNGKVYRYGGEEFTIVFPNKDVEMVLPYLDDLRCKIRDYDIVLRNELRKNSNKSDRKVNEKNHSTIVNVTISIGVAEHHGQRTFAQTLKLADKALYIAKKNGRNRVFV